LFSVVRTKVLLGKLLVILGAIDCIGSSIVCRAWRPNIPTFISNPLFHAFGGASLDWPRRGALRFHHHSGRHRRIDSQTDRSGEARGVIYWIWRRPGNRRL
jgi:hypothetical protein